MDHPDFLIIGGESYSLAHLQPRVVTCPRHDPTAEDAPLRILVRFSDHCYSRAFVEGVHLRSEAVGYGARKRAFCRERHEGSFSLPAIIDALPSQRVYQTAQTRNYVHFVYQPQFEGREYQVYFTLKKKPVEANDLLLFVESAYPAVEPPSLRKRPRNIRFQLLAWKVFRNEEVRFAAR
jgi:hypothetical protein